MYALVCNVFILEMLLGYKKVKSTGGKWNALYKHRMVTKFDRKKFEEETSKKKCLNKKKEKSENNIMQTTEAKSEKNELQNNTNISND